MQLLSVIKAMAAAVPYHVSDSASPSPRFIFDYSDFARVENWYPVVRTKTMPTTWFNLDHPTAAALLKHIELVNMFLKAEDLEPHENVNVLPGRLGWTSERYAKAEEKATPLLKEDQLKLLQELGKKLERHMQQFPTGAFVKLSSRSPKDAPLFCPETLSHLERLVKENPFPEGVDKFSLEALTLDGILFTRAITATMCIKNSQEALRLFYRSTRVFSDLTLAKVKASGEDLAMKVVVRKFNPEIQPEWEFRVWVINGQVTGASQYHSDLFVKEIWQSKQGIEHLILRFHSLISVNIPCQNYTLDLYIPPDLALEKVKIIEVNPPPPVAGGALYNWKLESDVKAATEGPFELRVLQNPSDNPLRTLTPPLRDFLDTLRGRKIPKDATIDISQPLWYNNYCVIS